MIDVQGLSLLTSCNISVDINSNINSGLFVSLHPCNCPLSRAIFKNALIELIPFLE